MSVMQIFDMQRLNIYITKHFVTEPWSSYVRKMDLMGLITHVDHVTSMAAAALYQVQVIVIH